MNFQRMILLTFLGACAADDRPPDGPFHRDSAGVRIVENPAEGPDLRWRVSAQPLVDIGGSSADENDALFRVVSAARLSDGQLVVANGGTYELRYYDSQGAFLHAVGRRGGGPGEFQSLGWMRRLADDSLITYDLRELRFSIFAKSGLFVRSFRLGTNDAVPFARVIGMYSDGSFLAQGFTNTGSVAPSGLQRYDVPLYHFAADGMFLADVGMFSGNDGYYKAFRNGGFSYYEAFFPRYTYRVAAGNYLYVAANDTYELRRYTPDGVLTGLVRREHTPIKVTADHLRHERDRRLEATPDDRRPVVANVLDEMPTPQTFPAYHLVRADDQGNVWVQAYPMPPLRQARWAVFDSTGVLLGDVDLPVGLDPKHIGTDFILGVWHDAFDVEHVQLYDLVKGD